MRNINNSQSSSSVIIVSYHRQLSPSVIIVSYHRQSSSSVIIVSYHRQLSSPVIIASYHRQLLHKLTRQIADAYEVSFSWFDDSPKLPSKAHLRETSLKISHFLNDDSPKPLWNSDSWETSTTVNHHRQLSSSVIIVNFFTNSLVK